MSEDKPGEDSDVEAEMLRMMQEEVGGEGDAAEEQQTGGDADQLLEQEMRRAMEMEDEAPGARAVTAFDAGGMQSALEPVEGIDRIADIDVTVTVELGGNLMAIRDILNWTQGSTVELEPEENDPVDVMVNGKLFAKGEVVVVGDTFGVRILELVDDGGG